MKAKEEISSNDEKIILNAVANLEELLRHPSFRRLEIQAQVQILFLLSKGYERLGHYQKQEKLLSDYAGRREFSRFHVPLLATLVRTYVQQERMQEAEAILSRLVKPSCAHLPLEDKGEIATVLAWKDDHMAQALRQADRLFAAGEWKMASDIYQRALISIEHLQFPYQTSPVEKKKLRQKILFRSAEASFFMGNFEETIRLLTDWDDLLFVTESDEPLCTRRLFLLGFANLKLEKRAVAETLFEKYKSTPLQKAPDLCTEVETVLLSETNPLPFSMTKSTPQLLWQAQEAIRLQAPVLLQATIEEMKRRKGVNTSLISILEGHLAALQNNLIVATEKIAEGIAPARGISAEWRQSALACFAQVCWKRTVMLLVSDQTAQAETVVTEFLSKTAMEDEPTLNTQRTVCTLLLAKLHHEEPVFTELQLSTSSLSDQLFRLWLDGSSATASCEYDELNSDPIALYLYARTMYYRALSDDLPYEDAMSDLQELVSNKMLLEVRPQILSWLTDIALHCGQHTLAYELLTELMNGYPTYPQLPQTILSCIIAFESTPNFDNERFSLCQYVLNRPIDSASLFLAIHLFQMKRWIAAEAGTPLFSVEKALLAQEEGKNIILEISKSREPGLIKSRIEAAKTAYETLRTHIIDACARISNPECQAMMWSLVFSSQQELLELLERSIVSEYAFNELPKLLEQTATLLHDDSATYSQRTCNWNRYLTVSFLSGCTRHALVAKLYCHTFSRDVDKALEDYRELTDERSSSFVRASLFLSKTLRESHKPNQAYTLITPFQHEEICEKDPELALEIALEKSLVLRELRKPNRAMALLAWVINGPYASSLRVKAMILRAEIYLSIHRTDLALRQLESVVAKGGEWAPVAQRKLQELYGTN